MMVNEELRELLDDFLLETDERLTRIEVALLASVEATADERQRAFQEVRRELHTLKGNSGMMGFSELQTLAHELEDRVDELDPANPDLKPLLEGIDRFKDGLAEAAGESQSPDDSGEGDGTPTERRQGSARVRLETLERLLETSTRLVVARHGLSDRIEAVAAVESNDPETRTALRDTWRQLDEAHRKLDRVLDLVQEQVQDLRTVPLNQLFSKLKRLVHDEAETTGKEVRFESRGGSTPLDIALSELATDTLGHLIRNAIVHGIEQPATRENLAKPRHGTVLVEAALRSGNVEIEVIDDGAGIDSARLRTVAAKAGFDDAETADLHRLVFHPGLSSRDSTDRSSGRGIGMSAVLASVHRYGGTIEVDTASGLGTRFCLRLPLTVAVTDALLVASGGERFAVPIGAIKETGHHDTLPNTEALNLKEFLDLPFQNSRPDFFVTVEVEGRRKAVLVDELGSLQRIVVNPLDALMGSPKGIVGSTVLGDGQVVLILDPPQLTYGGAQAATEVVQ